MKSMGFVISKKNNEKRRAILPEDLQGIKFVNQLYFEKSYGEELGYSDKDYQKYGVNIVDRDEALNCDIITDVKLGDAEYLEKLSKGKLLLGWAHAVQDTSFTDKILEGDHTVIAWEEMFKDGRYIYYRNREIAGEAAILHAYRYLGKMPYETKVAIMGNGQTAKGALRFLHGLGAQVDVYGRKLEELFKKDMFNYDVIVNCVMWDTNRTDRIIYKEDLKKFKKGTMIIDISCDPNLEIETSHPTTIENPIYIVDDIIHYAVDNTPAMFPHTVTKVLSKEFSKLVDNLIEDNWTDMIKDALVIKNGYIKDENIKKFREKRGLFCK